jgi:hypothetical protein
VDRSERAEKVNPEFLIINLDKAEAALYNDAAW